MDLARPDLRPDPSLEHDEMLALQREVARAARFVDDVDATPAAVAIDEPVSVPPLPEGAPVERGAVATADPAVLGGDGPAPGTAGGGGDEGPRPLVAGVDQAFRGEEAVSAVVVLRGDEVVARAASRVGLEMPYVPGLLAFREAGAIVDALAALPVEPDLLLLDGSGRIHYRQAGLATHVGVLFDVPALGVAKSLLCGEPAAPLDRHLAAGERVAVEADDEVEPVGPGGDGDRASHPVPDPDWPVVGYAVQTRQFPNPERRHVNPLFASPGHRLRAGTAADLVDALAAGYKLPEPTRLADALADDLP
ncbi:MAG: endonuclease V [Halobacteriaceae archaeon]